MNIMGGGGGKFPQKSTTFHYDWKFAQCATRFDDKKSSNLATLWSKQDQKPKSTCCKITSNLIQTRIHEIDASTLEIFNPMRFFDNIRQDSFFHIDSFSVDELEKSPSL